MAESYLLDLLRKINSATAPSSPKYTIKQLEKMFNDMPSQRIGALYDLAKLVKSNPHIRRQVVKISKFLFPSSDDRCIVQK